MQRVSSLTILLAITLLPRLAVGQTGELAGRVVDANTGQAVADATVHLESGPVTRTVVADDDGRWQARDLPNGSYQVAIGRIGYSQTSLTLSVPASGRSPITALTPHALQLDALVVTASRRLQRLADAPVTTELITRRDIEAARVPDISTLLTQRLGIQLEGGHPAGEGVMLQGLGSERVLVLLDGQPLAGRLSGTLDISRFPTSMVERIEVVKGSQSSLYGSDAMGGVVNIITRSSGAEPWRVGVDATTGSQGRMDLSGALSGNSGDFDLLLDLGRRMTEVAPGMEITTDALAERWDALAKLGWTPSETFRMDASLLLLDERQRWRSGQLYQFADNDQRGARLGAEWRSGAHRLVPNLHMTEFEHLARQAGISTPAAGSGERELQRLVEAEVLYNLGMGDAALDLGVEAKREQIRSDRVDGADRTQHTVEPFFQATIPLGALRIVPGARLTWSEEWGAHFTPRLATLYRPLPEVAVRASLGLGYRAPSFKELYMEFLNVGPGFSYTIRGNPLLQPETSTNVTLGVEWSPGPVYLRTQLFETRFDDFIETTLRGDSSGVDVYTYGNISRGFTRGMEVEGGFTHGPLRGEAGYAYLLAEDRETGDALLGRPAHSGRASLESAMPFGTRAALSGIYTGTTPVQRNEETVVEREGYLRFDATLSASLPAGLQISGGVRNLLDERPEQWPGFTGRHLFIGIGWRTAGTVENPSGGERYH